MEFAYLYSTSAGDASAIREKGYAIALCRAYNNYVHDEFAKVSPRLKPLAVFPQQDPEEAGARNSQGSHRARARRSFDQDDGSDFTARPSVLRSDL